MIRNHTLAWIRSGMPCVQEPMKKTVFIMTWLIVLLIEHWFISSSSPTRCWFNRMSREFTVIPVNSEYLVFTESEADEIDLSYSLLGETGCYWVRAYPKTKKGPWPGVLEWYRTTSYMPNPQSISAWSDNTISATRQKNIHQAVVDHAWTIPDLAEYAPGEPPITTFESGALSESLLMICLYSFIPTIIAYFATQVEWSGLLGTAQKRHALGQCIQCGYDCNGLPTSTCPECGQPHSQMQQITRKSNQS